ALGPGLLRAAQARLLRGKQGVKQMVGLLGVREQCHRIEGRAAARGTPVVIEGQRVEQGLVFTFHVEVGERVERTGLGQGRARLEPATCGLGAGRGWTRYRWGGETGRVGRARGATGNERLLDG